MLVEKRPHRRARRFAEELQRLGLGRHEAEPHTGQVVSPQVRRGQERKLVRGERPHCPPGNDERDRADVTRRDLVQQPFDQRDVDGAAKGERAGNRRERHGATRDEEQVVLDVRVRRRVREVAPLVDPDERPARERRADLGRESLEVEPRDLAEPERLRDRHGPVREVLIRRQELHRHALRRELAQGERGLQGGDAAARDQDLLLPGRIHAGSPRRRH